MYDHRVPLSIANAPRPQPPEVPRWHRRYIYYLDDLACWLAMKADCLQLGIDETEQAEK